MFEITQLKEKKLSELQEIAKELKISRYSSLKKLRLNISNFRCPGFKSC